MFVYTPHDNTFRWVSKIFPEPVSYQTIINTDGFKTYANLKKAFSDLVGVPPAPTNEQLAAPVGTQVLYLPHHAELDPNHRDAEAGFIWLWLSIGQAQMPSCRYFYRERLHRLPLRTTANGEQTPLSMLFPARYTSKERIAELLETIKAGYPQDFT